VRPKNRCEDNIKIDEVWDKVAGSCGQHYECLGHIKGVGFVNELSNCHLIRQDVALLVYVLINMVHAVGLIS
jgi:hypothetical protein